jgi:predicted O-methyltransferase YrrM
MVKPERDVVKTSESIGNRDNGCHLNDFLKYHDEIFVINAYRGVLKIKPDAHEVEQFLTELRLGKMSKVEILGRLRYSQEGREKGVKIRGLFWAFTIQSWFKIPVLGYFCRLTVGIFNLPTILTNLQTLETSAFAQLQRQRNDLDFVLKTYQSEIDKFKWVARQEELSSTISHNLELERKEASTEKSLPVAKVPLIKIADLLPHPVSLVVCEFESVDGNISVLELVMLCSLIRKQSPRNCFEIGTFDGRTTLNLAANMKPGMQIYTLDLPASSVEKAAFELEEADKKYICKERSGLRFAHSKYADRITQLFGDSATFDYSSLHGRMDFVFIDGSHSYEYVLSDSRTALRLLGPNGGTIVWHDYDTPYWPGVTRALNEFYMGDPIFAGLRRIQDTSLCVLQLNPDAAKNTGSF